MKTTIKRLAAGALAALCMLPFSGCGVLFSDDTEALMRPPRPTGDKAGIHELIEKAAGEGYTFKYPSSGDNRSAIIMQDLTNDGVEGGHRSLPEGRRFLDGREYHVYREKGRRVDEHGFVFHLGFPGGQRSCSATSTRTACRRQWSAGAADRAA